MSIGSLQIFIKKFTVHMSKTIMFNTYANKFPSFQALGAPLRASKACEDFKKSWKMFIKCLRFALILGWCTFLGKSASHLISFALNLNKYPIQSEGFQMTNRKCLGLFRNMGRTNERFPTLIIKLINFANMNF